MQLLSQLLLAIVRVFVPDVVSPFEAETATAVVAAAPAAPFKLMSPAREATFRQCFPKVGDRELAAVLDDPALLIYSDVEIPKAYQFFDGMNPGVHSVSYNISANGSEPFGNGNREFPWGTPAGTHRSKNVTAFRFLRLPRDAEGRLRPVVWHDDRRSGDGSYAWTFPVGTVFGEVLMVRGPERRDYTFEIRTRRRARAYWEVDVYRPFPTARTLAERIKHLRPDGQDDTNLREVCEHLEQSRNLKKEVLSDTQPGKRTFAQTMGVDVLPAIADEKLVAELLTGTTFRSALGAFWRESPEGAPTAAPTTLASFHVVPVNYDAGFVTVDSQSCMRCHDSVNESVREFNSGRDWYGRIRGSDGIFSFHPFDPSCISGNGFSQRVKMRAEFVSAGLLEKFDAARHSAEVYHELERSR